MTVGDVARLHRRLEQLLRAEKVRLDGIEVCYDHPEFTKECDCRKPRPGMILRAARKLGIDLEASWTIGDSPSDLDAGRAAGTKAGLVLTGYGKETLESESGRRADLVAGSLRILAKEILAFRSGN
jgi:D-glycero-D-manno-heptose 1,7-bisphosphate phosphatase